MNVFFCQLNPDFAHSGNRNSRHEEFALVIKHFAITKVLLFSFFPFPCVFSTLGFPVSLFLSCLSYVFLLFSCASRFSFPVVTVHLFVSLDLGQRWMFNHYWSFLGYYVFSPYFISCVPPSLVRQLGIFPCSDAWSLDPSLELSASSSRGCIQRAVKIAHGKGTGIYSCSITDREEYIGAFRWGVWL